jgi:hypothetical protein
MGIEFECEKKNLLTPWRKVTVANVAIGIPK